MEVCQKTGKKPGTVARALARAVEDLWDYGDSGKLIAYCQLTSANAHDRLVAKVLKLFVDVLMQPGVQDPRGFIDLGIVFSFSLSLTPAPSTSRGSPYSSLSR